MLWLKNSFAFSDRDIFFSSKGMITFHSYYGSPWRNVRNWGGGATSPKIQKKYYFFPLYIRIGIGTSLQRFSQSAFGQ